MLTAQVLRTLQPKLDPAAAETVARSLQAAADWFEINTVRRMAHFIAQLAYQSPTFAPRLGNTMPGDGYRFRGRGFIQITGRGNYTKYGEIIQRNIVDNPDLALRVDVSAHIAAAYWRENGCNRLADSGGVEAVEAITKKVNGGTHGLEERCRYFQLSEQALGGQP